MICLENTTFRSSSLKIPFIRLQFSFQSLMMKIITLLSILLILLQAYTGTSRRYYARHRLEALARYQSLRRRTQNEQNTCSKWRQTCSPWSNSKNKCCDPSSLVCKCNLWMQNCRCVNRIWGG